MHDVLFTSDAWNQWAATRYAPGSWHLSPVWSDIGRALTGFLLSMVGLQWLEIMPASYPRTINGMRLAPYELVLISVAVTSALFFAYFVLPSNFYMESIGRAASGVLKTSAPIAYGDVWRSYALYSPYVLGLWLGMGVSV